MQEEFSWTETTKGIVLSSFFVGYILLQVVSGTLANRYGGKLVLGVAVVWWSLFTVLTPPAALLSLPALIAARIALGLGEAAVFPRRSTWSVDGSDAQRSRAVALSPAASPSAPSSPPSLVARPRLWVAGAVLRVRTGRTVWARSDHQGPRGAASRGAVGGGAPSRGNACSATPRSGRSSSTTSATTGRCTSCSPGCPRTSRPPST
jgi:MFS family permease